MLPSARPSAAAAGTALAVLLTGAAATPATAQAPPSPEDYCPGGSCRDILPAGQNGNATLIEIIGNQLFGTRPKHSDTQLAPYEDLLYGYDDLTDATLGDYYLDASFGVPPGDVDREYQPRDDVTIIRDRQHGIPHIYGTTRGGTMYGAGYAAAEDRLFLMDLLRNLGRGELTGFAGGAQSNRALEQSLWRGAPYSEADKQAQIDRVAARGERGARALADVDAYLAGINAYIDRSQRRRDYPGEYVLTGHKDAITQAGEIEHFRRTDVVGIAAMVGLLFGGGGGGEVQSALVRASFVDQYGAEQGEALWRTWRTENDPEALTTIEAEFPYTGTPANPVGEAAPDPGSVVPHGLVHDATGSATSSSPTSSGALPGDLLDSAPGMSNALLVAGEHTESGNPVAVMGPQTAYYSPQLLMVQELQGPGISARGAAFPGVSFYVQMGRGVDYAWSATSANQDITDTFAVALCEPDGSDPSVDSRAYLYQGECVGFEELSVHNEWEPTTADPTPAGSYTLTALRSAYGLIDSFGTVDGQPVAFATRRSTYLREVDSILGFQKFNEPQTITSAAAFQQAAMDIGYAFNWFYADADDIAYVNSGANPVRLAGTNPNLPIGADSEAGWAGWDPATNRAEYTPLAEHPNSRNADYYVNWNNQPAPGYTSGYGTGSVHRGDLLDQRVSALIDQGHAFTTASLVQVMAQAGSTDLRGEQVLPELLRVLESEPIGDPELAGAVADLRAWLDDGAQRRETAQGSGSYAHAEAIQVMDAWWRPLVEGMFRPGLGEQLYTALTGVVQVDESPSGDLGGGAPGDINQGQTHKGSSFQYGWWSYVDKELRTVLGDPVAAPFGEEYCGDGDLAACRTVLLDSLREAVDTPAAQVYPGDDECDPGDQVCADSIVHSPLGGITMDRIAWQNRPTYQLAIQFPDRRG